jgi:hypothetical protein
VKELISEKFAQLKETKTSKFGYPVTVRTEFAWNHTKFRIIFTGSRQKFMTDWLWNTEFFDKKNTLMINSKLKRVECYIQQELERNNEITVSDLRRFSIRKKYLQNKLNRLF